MVKVANVKCLYDLECNFLKCCFKFLIKQEVSNKIITSSVSHLQFNFFSDLSAFQQTLKMPNSIEYYVVLAKYVRGKEMDEYQYSSTIINCI